ncbi:MAG: hypothetical protein AAF799_24330 [Myxococcota bacterium]
MTSSRRCLATPGLLVALGLSLACEPPGATAPSRVPVRPDAVLNVPYPVSEPERIEGAGRKTLSEAQFVFISLGAPPDERDHALPERVASEGPMLLAHHFGPVGTHATAWQELRRLAFGRGIPPRGQAQPVPAEEVEALGLQAPASSVWLVGPDGSCRAEVGEPLVGVYDGPEDTVAVGYRLEGCSGRRWAQVGIISDGIPVDFRWVPAELSSEQILAYGSEWDDPLPTLVDPPAWSHAMTPGFDQVRVHEIPDVSPRVLQLHRAWTSEHPDRTERAWCEIEAAWSHTEGWYNGRWIDPVPWVPDATDPFLLGAFVNGEQVDAVLYDDRFDGLVVVPPGPLDDMNDASAWTQVFVPTGHYHDDELTRWGVEPARGALPLGPRCETDGDSP